MTIEKGTTILLVEDEAVIAIAAARTIMQFAYEVVTISECESIGRNGGKESSLFREQQIAISAASGFLSEKRKMQTT